MKERLIQLAEACGPIGNETNVRALLKELVAPYADEVREDVIGNLIVTKKGTAADRKHLLVVAHMDEPALIVITVDSDGFLRTGAVGTHEAAYLVGQRVEFPNGTVGVVGTESFNSPGDVTHMGLFVDIGATSKEEALEKVKPGDSCVLKQPVIELGEHRVAGKALDNRVGCAVAVEVLKRLGTPAHDISIVFSAQQGVGNGRGVKTAAFGLEPDFGLVIDGVKTGDTPGAGRMEIELGGGVSVKILDKTVIIPPRIKNYLVDQAEAANIAYQLEVYADGSSDAGALLISRDGVPTGGLSIPVRYGVTGSEMVDLRDVEAATNLAVLALQNYQA
ncbi:MAG: M42 family metallopeptidase [Tumebacillaceae bacterium]